MVTLKMRKTPPVTKQLALDVATQATAVLQGTLSDEAFKPLRLSVGAHRQRQGDGYMVRIRIPGGRLSLAQWLVAADVVHAHASRAHLTLRQDLQLYHVGLPELASAVAALNRHGLSTYASGGSSVRNVTAGILGDQDPRAFFDPYPYAAALSARLSEHPLFNALPRKFKIGFAGPGPEEAQGWLNDLGFIASHRDGFRGFRLIAGGGLGASPQNGFEIEPFILAQLSSAYAEAALEYFAELSPKDKPLSNRFKFILRAQGVEQVQAEIRKRVVSKKPNEPFVSEPKPAGATLWIETSVGDLSPAQMLGLGQALQKADAKEVRISFDQRLLIPGLHVSALPDLQDAIHTLGLTASFQRDPVRQVVCAGPDTCNRGLVNSKALGRELGTLKLPVSLHISGCQNGCSQHLIAPLSLQGTVRMGAQGRQPAYQLRVGRPLDSAGLKFGPVLLTVGARRVKPALERLLEIWQDSANDQGFEHWLENRGSAGITHDLGPLLTVNGPDLERDCGTDKVFEVALGNSECH